MSSIANTMEDSGIDSDPKPSASSISTVSTISSTTTTTSSTSTPTSGVTFTTTNRDDEKAFPANEISFSSNHHKQQNHQRRSTTKILQQKLEARIEQAKRIQRSNKEYIEVTENSCKKTKMISTKSTGLIPIERLNTPHQGESLTHHERYPLVQYWQSDTSDSGDETTIFPLSRDNQSSHKQDLTDTFSIQGSSGESEDSLNLMVPTCHHASHVHSRSFTPIGCCNCPCRII